MSTGSLMAADEFVIDLMDPREMIEQAIGVLMSEHQVDRDTAFEMLVQGSTSSRLRVRTVAEQILRQSRRSE